MAFGLSASFPAMGEYRHDDEVNGALLSRDETRILSWSEDKTVRLWDVATGRQIGPAMTHDDFVNGALLSRDESRILSWSWDMTVRLWERVLARSQPAGNCLQSLAARPRSIGCLDTLWHQDCRSDLPTRQSDPNSIEGAPGMRLRALPHFSRRKPPPGGCPIAREHFGNAWSDCAMATDRANPHEGLSERATRERRFVGLAGLT